MSSLKVTFLSPLILIVSLFSHPAQSARMGFDREELCKNFNKSPTFANLVEADGVRIAFEAIFYNCSLSQIKKVTMYALDHLDNDKYAEALAPVLEYVRGRRALPEDRDLILYVLNKKGFDWSKINKSSKEDVYSTVGTYGNYKDGLRILLKDLDKVFHFSQAELHRMFQWDFGKSAREGQLEYVKFFIDELKMDPNAVLETRHCDGDLCWYATGTPISLALQNNFDVVGGSFSVSKTSSKSGDVIRYLLSLPELRFDVTYKANSGLEVNYAIRELTSGEANRLFIDLLLKDSRFKALKLTERMATEGLQYAAYINSVEGAKYFIGKGARNQFQTGECFHKYNGRCISAASAAATEGNKEVLKFILESPTLETSEDVVLSAILNGYEIFKVLADSGKYDLNAKLDGRYSVISTAAAYGQYRIVDLLLKEFNANPNEVSLPDAVMSNMEFDTRSKYYEYKQIAYAKMAKVLLDHPKTQFDQESLVVAALWSRNSQLVEAVLTHPKMDFTKESKICYPFVALTATGQTHAMFNSTLKVTLKHATDKCLSVTAIELVNRRYGIEYLPEMKAIFTDRRFDPDLPIDLAKQIYSPDQRVYPFYLPKAVMSVNEVFEWRTSSRFLDAAKDEYFKKISEALEAALP